MRPRGAFGKTPSAATSVDAEDAYERRLRRRQRRLERYLRARGWLGLLLVGLGLAPLAVAVLVLGHTFGWWFVESLARWTRGFDAVLAVFLPSALAWLLIRSGWAYWRHRRPSSGDTGCLVA